MKKKCLYYELIFEFECEKKDLKNEGMILSRSYRRREERRCLICCHLLRIIERGGFEDKSN